MTRQKYSVLIPDAQSGHALVVARCLAQAGIEVFALGAADNTALQYSRRKRKYWKIPESIRESPQLLMDYIGEKIALTKADVYLPIDEPGHRHAIKYRQEFAGLIHLCPLAELEIFDTLTRKDQLADFLEREGIPGPQTVRLNDSGWLAGAPPDITFPAIAKPAYGDGGKGISMIAGAKELEKMYADPKRKSYGDYILQEYIRGYDIDCSVLCVNGEIVASTIQAAVVNRRRAYAAAGGIRFLHEPRLLDLVSQMFKRARFSGIAHVDARYDEDCNDFKIIEVNARYWGSLTASLRAGVNFPYLATQVALGRDFSIPAYAETQYIDLLTYSRSLFSQHKQSDATKFRIVDTDLKYFLLDPIAEVANLMLRRAN